MLPPRPTGSRSDRGRRSRARQHGAGALSAGAVASVGYRVYHYRLFDLGWTSFLALPFLFRLPLLLIGFPWEMLVLVAGINLVYQFWIHTETIDRLPRWFEAVMNTPSHHRVHHATNPRYLDTNYAGVFIVWDRLFGTFVPEHPAAARPATC